MIKISDLNVNLPGFSLKSVSLEVQSREYFIIVGPYASGKTVLLETLAGFHRPTSGSILVGGQDVTLLEPEKRGVGVVYQDCALFPHLSVKQNIEFGLRVTKTRPQEIAERLSQVVKLLGIEHLLDRNIRGLSGGERQKVALARAVLPKPKALLLDEPLGALDPYSREEVRSVLVRLHEALRIPIIHITHDFEEAAEMGSRMAVMGGGRIHQVGTPYDVFRHPGSEFVARFTMAVNIFRGKAYQTDDGELIFETGDTRLVCTGAVRGDCSAAIRPENISVCAAMPDANRTNVLTATVQKSVFRGSVVSVYLAGSLSLSVMLTQSAFEQMGLEPGQKVFLSIPPSSVALFSGQKKG